MTSKQGPRHVVVDGSNIATEGRSLPSLAQLSEAVASFMEEHPDTAITVVVDATFGHRIEKKEVAEFEAGISNNELVAPPAGAIGRGDAFVLSIAQKAGASILSNDSFQEFHADYEWLFDEGRLIGGKPVPHVGWVFVNRSPVRGPVSRKVTQGAKTRGGSKRDGRKAAAGRGSPLANEPMPVPKSPPPRRSSRGSDNGSASSADDTAKQTAVAASATPRAGEVVNELMPFLEFVEHHPIGTSVNGTVDAYSSHGAYISIGSDGVRGYIPLRLMSDPPPTSARKVMQIGEAVTVVVVSFAAARRSIDCAMPDMAAHAPVDTDPLAADEADQPKSGRRGRGRKQVATDESPTPVEEPTSESPAPKKARARKAPAKDAAKASAEKVPAKKAPAKKAPAKKAPATKTPAKKSPAKKTPGKKAPAKKVPAKKAPAEKAPAKKAPAEKVPAKKAAARKAPAKKAPAKKAPAKQAPARQREAGTPSAEMAPATKRSRKAPARPASSTVQSEGGG